MIDVIWEKVANLTPASAECPKCAKIYQIDNSKWNMWFESPLAGRIMNSLCCDGFWAIWVRGTTPGVWEFKFKTRGIYVRRSYGNS